MPARLEERRSGHKKKGELVPALQWVKLAAAKKGARPMATRAMCGLAALALLAACEMKIGRDEASRGEKAETAEAAAEGKAKDGSFSLKAPGIDMEIDIPEVTTDISDADNEILYPGSSINGVHIEASDAGKKNGSNGVELRFASKDAPEKVLAWYRDAARASIFSVASVAREGSGFVVSGTEKGDGDPFTIKLSPAAGGTEGRLLLTDRN
jgi:hypothetical protein